MLTKIPNILTLGQIVAIPVLVLSLVFLDPHWQIGWHSHFTLLPA